MRKFKFVLVILLAVILQMTIINIFNFFGIRPDFFIVLCFIASIIFKQKTAISFSIFIGVLKDILTVSNFGIHTFLFPLVCLSLRQIKKNISLDNDYIAGFFLLIYILVCDIVINFITRSYSPHISIPVFIRVFLLEAIYSVVIFLFLYKKFKIVR